MEFFPNPARRYILAQFDHAHFYREAERSIRSKGINRDSNVPVSWTRSERISGRAAGLWVEGDLQCIALGSPKWHSSRQDTQRFDLLDGRLRAHMVIFEH